MADAYIGEIRIFAGSYAPSGWAFCNGQIMQVSQNPALFSILGVQYGGDGITTFALPNLRARTPIHQGQGNGLTARNVGNQVGNATETLSVAQIPSHNHITMAIDKPVRADDPGADNPANRIWSTTKTSSGRPPVSKALYDMSLNTEMHPQALGGAGGSQPHNNMQPYLEMNFIICVSEGEYPVKP